MSTGIASKLGVTHCDDCGLPATAVGELDNEGVCPYCSTDRRVFRLLTAEAEKPMRSGLEQFIKDCGARDVPMDKLLDSAKAAIENLHQYLAEVKEEGGYTGINS